MSNTIVVRNTVAITEKLARQLARIDANNDVFYFAQEVRQGGVLRLPIRGVVDIFAVPRLGDQFMTALLRANVNGDIAFAELPNKIWGYRFDGRGGMYKLSGDMYYSQSSVRRTAPVEQLLPHIDLYYNDGYGSDKEYHLGVKKARGGYHVTFSNGRRGGALRTGTRTNTPVTYAEAVALYNKVKNQKLNKGYEEE